MEQFLNMLNMTTNYVILRNFEDLPDKFLPLDRSCIKFCSIIKFSFEGSNL